MHDVMRAVKRTAHCLTARITSCIKYLIYRIFNNNLRYIIVLVWHSNLTKENKNFFRTF